MQAIFNSGLTVFNIWDISYTWWQLYVTRVEQHYAAQLKEQQKTKPEARRG